MIVAAYVFGVRFPLSAAEWAGWGAALFLVAFGFACLFLAITARSKDWQTPGVVANFNTMPLMFASAALFPNSAFPGWMQAISNVNPITFSAELGRAFLLGTAVDGWNLGYLAAFAAVAAVIGYRVSARWLKVD